MKNVILAVMLATAGVAFAADVVKVEPTTVAAPAAKVEAPKTEVKDVEKKVAKKAETPVKSQKPVAKDEKAATPVAPAVQAKPVSAN